jgi:predicted ATPase
VTVFGAGEADGVLWQAMRLVQGSDLKSLLRRERVLDPASAVRLFAQVGAALDAAHERGLVHRDVKPANILVEGAPPDARAYVADFGLAKAEATGLTATGHVVGTIGYMAPEQIRGQALDGRADVYSLACALYECLAGEPPFAGRADVAVLYAHLQDAPPPLTERRPELPGGLDAVLARGLAKTPDARPASAGALVEEVRAALESPARVASAASAHPATRGPRLIGRDRELREVRELLREHRLVTLVGAGGSGKTRLALELLDAAAGDYPDGAWWVPLQDVRDPGHVVPAIADSVGARVSLAAHLGSRAALLVLDNFEQVAAAADAVAELLRDAPEVKALVTAREPLRLSFEQEYPVLPLADEDAVALFVQRARRVQPDFESDAAVAELCLRLDGLPLAIELAAARVKVLTTAQLLARMDRRLPVLTGGPRDLPERQRTLRATIEWSHDLLTPEEQSLFARLAIFQGGCTLEAAVEVCDADLDVLAALVDKSLVRRDGDRFGMLETIHEYAAELLTESGEEDAVCERHAEHYLARAREIAATRPGSRWFELAREFHRDAPNTRLAVGRLLDSSPALALELALPPTLQWASREGMNESRVLLEEILSRAADASPSLRARALVVLGRLAELTSFERAAGFYEASLALASRAGAEQEIALALLALRRYADAAAMYRRLGDDHGTARSLHRRGDELRDRGDLALARELLEESVALARAVGDPGILATVLHSLADCALDDGRVDDAARLYHESLDVAARTDTASTTAYCLGGLAAVEARRGRPFSAARLWQAVESFEQHSGCLQLATSERTRYERALAGVPLSPPAEGRWDSVLADAVAYARNLSPS